MAIGNGRRAIGHQRSAFEGLTVAVAAGHSTERLALLLALAYRARRVAEGDDAEHLEAVGEAEDGLGAFQAAETGPVRPDPFRPRGKHHRLRGPAGVRNG